LNLLLKFTVDNVWMLAYILIPINNLKGIIMKVSIMKPSLLAHIEQKYIGKYVIVRALASGVHFGRAIIYDPMTNHCILEDVRRIYSYVDRFTLSEVSQQGVTDKALLCISVPDIMICDVIEMIRVSPEAEVNLQEMKTHVAPRSYSYDGTDTSLLV